MNLTVCADAVIAALENTHIEVRDAERDVKSTAGWAGTPGQSTFHGYYVVDPVPGGAIDGDLGADDLAWWPFQVTSIGATRRQAMDLADTARRVLTPGLLGGVHVLRVEPVGFGGVRRDDTLSPPLFYSPDRYRAYVAG